LVGRIAVIVFNVPFLYNYHFPNFFKDLWGHALGRPPLFQIKFELVPIYLELSFILFAKFLLFLMAIPKAKNFKIQNFLHLLKKCEQQTLSL